MVNKSILEIDKDGNKHWYLNDKLHRENGPAVECYNGDKYWYLNGNLHREGCPAIEYVSGSKYWYYNGKDLNCKSQKEFKSLIKLKILW